MHPSGFPLPAVPFIIVGGVALTAAEAAAASFGLSMVGCFYVPPCRQAMNDAVAQAIHDAAQAANDAGNAIANVCTAIGKGPFWSPL